MGSLSSPNIQFWGLIVHAGKPAKVRLEKADGLMEMFHLTNVALSDLKGKRPCQLKVKAPNQDQQFVLGTLVPGQLFQFQTDLLLQPDTEFSHTGEGDVHISGYKYDLLIYTSIIWNAHEYQSLSWLWIFRHPERHVSRLNTSIKDGYHVARQGLSNESKKERQLVMG